MWQGIKSRLRGRSKTSGSGNGGEDDGRHQARIQRQAKEAEKTIAKTASRELLEWEQRQGYRRTSTLTMPSFPASGSSSSQQMGQQQQQQRVSTSHHRRSFSTAKTLAESEHPSPALTMTKSLHDDQHVKASLPIISTSDQPSGNGGAGGENREQLLQEIEAIRKSIDQLRTTTPTLNIDISGTDDLPRPPSASAMTRAHTSSPTGGRQAPWLTPDRSPRPSSVFVGSSTTLSSPGGMAAGTTTPDGSSRQRRKSVADLFEQDAPRPYVPLPVSPSPAKAVASGPPQLPPVSGARHSHEGRSARPASPHQQQQQYLQPQRRRTKSSAAVAHSQQAAGSTPLPSFPRSTSFKSGLSAVSSTPSPPPLPLDAQGKIAALRAGATSPVPPPQLNPQPRPQQQRRQIIDTPQEARKRLSTAIGRAPRPGGTTPTKRHSMYSSGTGGDSGCVAIGGATPGGTTALTMSELQDRHQAKLRELQAPANARVKEAAQLAEARAEWGERLERERREQLAREEEKKRRAAIEAEQRELSAKAGGGMTSSASGSGGFAALKSFRRRTMSAADVLQSPTTQGRDQAASPQQQASVPEQDFPAATQQQQQRRPPLSPLNGVGGASRSMSTKRLDGAQRAREWRKSLVSLPAGPEPVDQLGVGVGVDEFGQPQQLQQQRPSSSLGLAVPDQYHHQGPGQAQAQAQAQARPRPTPLSRPAGDRTKSMYGRVPMAGVIAEADEAGLAQLQQEQQQRPEQQQRRLTATDLRRMREGAGQQGQRQRQQQGQRPRSVLLA